MQFAAFCSWEREKSLSNPLLFQYLCLCSFPLAAELRPEAAKLNMVPGKIKELIFHVAPKEKLNVVLFCLGCVCGAQVGFAAQELHICVLAQFSSRALGMLCPSS